MYKICYIYLRDSEYATQFVTYFRQKLPKQVEIKMISERQEPMEISEAAIVISDDRQFLEEFSREGIYLSSQKAMHLGQHGVKSSRNGNVSICDNGF